jgi:hypothetical protein
MEKALSGLESLTMRKITTITEDEMIAAFLYAELHSPRFCKVIETYLQRYDVDRHIIQAPDLQNGQENAFRRTILAAYRDYGQGWGYFEGFPGEVRWERVGLTKQEVEQVKYIEYDYWVELSGGSRLALYGAKRALAGINVFGLSSKYFVDIAETLRHGAQFPTLIFVGRNEENYLVVLEGHTRLTAYLIASECLPAELEVIVGFSEQITQWGCY